MQTRAWAIPETIDPMETILQQWKKLTTEETVLIGSESWEELRRVQAAKQRLQQEFELLRPGHRPPAAAAQPALPTHFAALLNDLINLERANSTLLSLAQHRLYQQLTLAGKTAHNLREVQRAYSSARPSHWQSYS